MTSEQTIDPVALGDLTVGTFAATTEAFVHGLCGAQFGDLEFDVGKSIRWTQWFVDDLLITDISTGQQRYWVVNWSLTFPQAFHHVTSVNFFYDTVAFRKAQFAEAQRQLIMEDNDWVLFVDAHEGMSCDTRSQPTDVSVQPFKSYVTREIQRAVDASKDRAVIPFYVFLRDEDVQNIEYPTPAFEDDPTIPFDTATLSTGVPYYLPYQGLTRLVKVSALKNPAFDWASIDTPSAPDANVKLQIVSYGYAHWNVQDVVPPATSPPPLDAANDDGWRMRNLLSMVRPIGDFSPPTPVEIRYTAVPSRQASFRFPGVVEDWATKKNFVCSWNPGFAGPGTDPLTACNGVTLDDQAGAVPMLQGDGATPVTAALFNQWVADQTVLQALRSEDEWRVYAASATLPFGTTWQSPASDPAGSAGPWCGMQDNAPTIGGSSTGPYLVPTEGTATTPDPGPLPATCTLVFKVDGATAQDQALAGQWEGGSSWVIRRSANGQYVQYGSSDGSGVGITHTVNGPPIVAGTAYVALAMTNTGTGMMSCWTSPDGATWTKGADSATKPAIALFDSTGPVRIGAQGPSGLPWNGRIYWVELRTGLDPAAGDIIWRFDAAEAQANPYTDPRGQVWSLTLLTAIHPSELLPIGTTPPTPPAATAGILVPLYDAVFRINLRDGLWYEQGELGNIPLVWDDATQSWVPRPGFDPEEWAPDSVYVETP